MNKTTITAYVIAMAFFTAPIATRAGNSGLSEPQKDEIARNLPYVSDERRQLFRKRFLNGKGRRAFALSKDGAFGGRWDMNMSMEEIRAWVLESCESKPQYRPENPCFIYMENDTVRGVPVMAAENERVLLSESDPPIHIGDGRGEIEDIEDSLRRSSPPDQHTWTFELDEVPDNMIFTVTIFSLTEQWDCPTTAWLNGTRVYDLRRGENVGTGRTTTAQFPVEKQHLKVGRNTITVREEDCRDTQFAALNDSLIKGLSYIVVNK